MQIRELNSLDVINNRDEKPKNQMGCSRTKEKEGIFTVTDNEKKSGSQEILGNRERLGYRDNLERVKALIRKLTSKILVCLFKLLSAPSTMFSQCWHLLHFCPVLSQFLKSRWRNKNLCKYNLFIRPSLDQIVVKTQNSQIIRGAKIPPLQIVQHLYQLKTRIKETWQLSTC